MLCDVLLTSMFVTSNTDYVQVLLIANFIHCHLAAHATHFMYTVQLKDR
jgi:hypothetical protein